MGKKSTIWVVFLLLFTIELWAQYLNPIVPDFQVNDSSGSIGARQIKSTIASNQNGQNIIVWFDFRNSSYDIYGQFLDDAGNFIGQNIQLVSQASYLEPYYPSVSMDNDGNFLVSWFADLMSEYQIRFQRFSSTGVALDTVRQINHFINNCYHIDSDMGKNGNFVITWENYTNNFHIYAQLFDSTGTPITGIFAVSSDTVNGYQQSPTVSFAPDGSFIISWIGEVDGSYGAFYQRFNQNGTPEGSYVKFDEQAISGIPVHRDMGIAFDQNGNFVIVWRSLIMNHRMLFAQSFQSDGTPIGNNFQLNHDSLEVFHDLNSTIGVSADISGHFVATWEGRIPSGGYPNIYMQRFSLDGTLLGGNLKVNTSGSYDYAMAPDVAANASSILVAWNGIATYDKDINLQIYSDNGTPIGDNIKVNDDSLCYAGQVFPAIAIAQNGNFVVAWQDYRYGDPNIYARVYTFDGTPLTENFPVVADSLSQKFIYPDVAMDSVGNFIVAWMNNPNLLHNDIFIKRFSPDGNPISTYIQTNSDSFNIPFELNGLSVAMASNGNFVLTWNEQQEPDPIRIKAQLFDQNGNQITNVFQVNSEINSNVVAYPDVAMDRTGNFAISWLKLYQNQYFVCVKLFSSNGIPISPEIVVNEDSTHTILISRIGMNRNGEFVIAWYQYNDSLASFLLKAQRFTSDGNKVGNNFQVGDAGTQSSSYPTRPSVSMETNGNFLIVWRIDDQIAGQRYDSDGNPIGTNFLVFQAPGASHRNYPVSVLWNDRIYTTWQEKRNPHTGIDVWANILDFNTPVSISQQNSGTIPCDYELYQNYPNPFNPSTTITYQLPHTSQVELTVFNALGKKIKTLIHTQQAAGLYQVCWDGKDQNGVPVSSGIYFYQIKTETFSKTKKMILMR